MVVRIIRRIGFPYGDFSVFLAIFNGKKLIVVKRNNKIVFKTKDNKVKSKKEAFKKAKELSIESVKL